MLLKVAFFKVMWVLDISVKGPVKNSLSSGDISRILTTDPFAINTYVGYVTQLLV